MIPSSPTARHCQRSLRLPYRHREVSGWSLFAFDRGSILFDNAFVLAYARSTLLFFLPYSPNSLPMSLSDKLISQNLALLSSNLVSYCEDRFNEDHVA
jgi:hypothetical protein